MGKKSDKAAITEEVITSMLAAFVFSVVTRVIKVALLAIKFVQPKNPITKGGEFI